MREKAFYLIQHSTQNRKIENDVQHVEGGRPFSHQTNKCIYMNATVKKYIKSSTCNALQDNIFCEVTGLGLV